MNDLETVALDRAWAVLSPPRSDELASFPLDIVFGDRASRVAVDLAGGRHLLIPSAGEVVTLDPRPAVLSAVTRSLTFGDLQTTFLDVSCSDPDLHPEFDEVIVDLLDAARGSDRPASVAAEALSRWRRLFRSRLLGGISHQAKIGLFAELSVLSALVDADPQFPAEAWRGPLREPHDFEATARCIEVKALGERSDSFVVHGLQQLDSHDARPLDLVLLTVAADLDGTGIADLVSSLLPRIADPAVLRTRLTAAGWNQDPEATDPDRFTISAVIQVNVNDSLPRLVRSALVTGSLPSGIAGLQYKVDVAAVLPLAAGASLARVAEEAVR